MARPLRIDVAGGWYHITSRGQNRERIFLDARDRSHFLELAKAVVGRFRVEVHAYVLMPNHYHLLLRSPEANTSRALQWLNQSYGLWWNRRHRRAGHVFQGRFKSVLVEGGGWILALGLYLHFNPVAVKKLGLGKSAKRAEGLGLKEPTAEIVKARLETLRTFRWSSYRGYAGYEPLPEWLSSGEMLRRVDGERDGYRRLAEDRLRQGQPEDLWTNLRWGAALGSERFLDKVRKDIKVSRETSGRQALRRRVTWERVILALERTRNAKWEDFRDRHGDWGRDLALWTARRYTGLTLRELGMRAGGMDYAAVSEALRYFERKKMKRREVRAARNRIDQFLILET